ncbi:MAG: hypothetical protein ACLU3R_05340 [Acutalibacteraceae bacterium]
MKKTISALAIALVFALCATAMTACGNVYDVYLPIGDARVDNDNVACNYTINEKLKDGYELRGYFTAESEANLEGEFIFSISFDDRYSGTFHESVLYSFTGEQLKNAPGGKLQFTVIIENLSNIFPKTDEQKAFALHFHRADAKRSDMIHWNASDYTYTFDGTEVLLTK